MPYIERTERKALDKGIIQISTPGQLNYAFTQLILDYIETKEESYQTYNDIIGALEGAKLELYRRQVSVYEEGKCLANGDVYDR